MTRLFTTSEVAKLLGIHQTTVIDHIKRGSLKAIVMDGQYFIRADDVENLREVVEKSVSERMKEMTESRNISELYKFCVEGRFEEIAKLLNLAKKPSSASDCFSVVNEVMKRKLNKI